MARNWTAAPCDLPREHLDLNGASFAANPQDFFPEEANIDKMPARTSHARDATAYAAGSTNDSWCARLRGWTRIGNDATSSQGTTT